jgi:hypothetical protein
MTANPAANLAANLIPLELADPGTTSVSDLWEVTGDFGEEGVTILLIATDFAELSKKVSRLYRGITTFDALRLRVPTELHEGTIDVRLGGDSTIRRDTEVHIEFYYGDFTATDVPVWLLALLLGHRPDDPEPLDLNALIESRPDETAAWAQLLRTAGDLPNLGTAKNLYIVDVDLDFWGKQQFAADTAPARPSRDVRALASGSSDQPSDQRI